MSRYFIDYDHAIVCGIFLDKILAEVNLMSKKIDWFHELYRSSDILDT